MTRIIHYFCIIFITFLTTYVNAKKINILGIDSFNPKVTQICPTGGVCKSVESKYFSVNLKETIILYKIKTDIEIGEFTTISLDYYILVYYI